MTTEPHNTHSEVEQSPADDTSLGRALPPQPSRFDRRDILRAGGVVGATTLAGALVGGLTKYLPDTRSPEPPAQETARGNELFGQETTPFFGVRQAGITTPAQTLVALIAFDVVPDLGKEGARRMLSILTADAARLTQGAPPLADTEPELAYAPAKLTVTVGVGPRFFDRAHIAHQRPSWLQDLPSYRIDRLEDRWNGGDLIVQICGDDEMSVAHTRRVVTRQIRRWATPRWVQRGFKSARGSTPENQTMRNLMGQVDGTANPQEAHHNDFVWCNAESGVWEHGTSMVVRRIAMNLDTWDEVDRVGREDVMGRRLDTGAPLTGTHEFDEPDFDAKTPLGFPVISSYSHVRRARSENTQEQIFRRAYNYDDEPTDTQLSNSGLVFVSFQADIVRQYMPLQQRLADLDALNEWTTPIGSAVFAIFPGAGEGEYLGQRIIES
ncbi:Dyp-type peroxidase [Timonella sp. A28]|uniref:Dyp-type peroxidase n=1 Tax=Timonella sp. A28 TaxID=3442640 RepID=UPI003EB815E4